MLREIAALEDVDRPACVGSRDSCALSSRTPPSGGQGVGPDPC